MELPTVPCPHLIRVRSRNVIFRVLACREISREEAIAEARGFRRRLGKKIGRNCTYEVYSMIGGKEALR